MTCQLVALESRERHRTYFASRISDGLDTRFRAPAARLALSRKLTVLSPFSVGADRDALGQELAGRVRGEGQDYVQCE